MARVALFVPDLLFGSKLLGALRAAGHQTVLVQDPAQLDAGAVDVLVVDLTSDAAARIAAASKLTGVAKLAFYAHVEPEVRALAERNGFDTVVPRSRMNREAAVLVSRLSDPAG